MWFVAPNIIKPYNGKTAVATIRGRCFMQVAFDNILRTTIV